MLLSTNILTKHSKFLSWISPKVVLKYQQLLFVAFFTLIPAGWTYLAEVRCSILLGSFHVRPISCLAPFLGPRNRSTSTKQLLGTVNWARFHKQCQNYRHKANFDNYPWILNIWKLNAVRNETNQTPITVVWSNLACCFEIRKLPTYGVTAAHMEINLDAVKGEGILATITVIW